MITVYNINSTANISCLAQGFAVGWTSPTIPLLLSDASPFASGPVSTETAAWIGSVLALGGALGTLLFGFCSNFIGSKRALLLSALPSMVKAFLVSQNVFDGEFALWNYKTNGFVGVFRFRSTG